jgi:hypothetical protein
LKLDEVLNLNIAGSVYYPRLLRYDAGLDLHFLQNLTNGNNQILPAGFLNLNFLEKKPYGLTLFGRVAEGQVEQVFARNFDTRTESYGGNLRYDLGPLPFRIGYVHRFYTRTGVAISDLDEVTDEVEFLGNYRVREGSDGNIRYRFSDETLRGQPSQRHELVANNITYFDPARRKRFMGNLRYYDWTGRTDTSDASLSGTYDWAHTNTLSTNYHFDYAHRTFNEQKSNTYNLRSSVHHQLYSSLSSDAAIFGTLQDATSGLVGEYGVEFAERYMKRLGGWGRLGIGFMPRVRWQQFRPDQRTAFILDERVTFPPTDRAELRQLDIDPSSIVVTTTDGATTFQEGFDYAIDRIDRRTILERIPTGSIPPGGTVLVDYRYRSSGTDNDILQYGFNSNMDISYRDWGTFFVVIDTKREDVVAGVTDRRLDNRDRQEFGFRTRGRWYTALVAFDWEDWDVRSSNGNLQVLTLSTPWPGRWRGNMSATHRGRSFTNPSEDLEEWRVNASLNVRVGKRGVFEIEPEYVSQIWTGGESVDGRDLESFGARASLLWDFRLISVRAEGSVFNIRRPAVRGIYDRFFVGIRRYF